MLEMYKTRNTEKLLGPGKSRSEAICEFSLLRSNDSFLITSSVVIRTFVVVYSIRKSVAIKFFYSRTDVHQSVRVRGSHGQVQGSDASKSEEC